jgi:LysM repeat protein
MASTIGIKIANGEFYSILEENSDVKKRLILTTVHDNQGSMQIDLYKSYTRSMADALYIGSIVVEKIKAKSKGGPSVELIIASNTDGEITADAIDLDASPHAEHMHLGVSLKSIDEDSRDADLPDFELESHEPPPQGLYERASASKARQDRPQSRQEFPWVVLIIIGVLIILLGLGLWFFLFRSRSNAVIWETVAITPNPREQPADPWASSSPASSSPASSSPASSSPVSSGPATLSPAATVQIPAPPEPAAPVAASPGNSRSQTPVIQAPAEAPVINTRQTAARRDRIAPPVASYKVPASIPRQGAPYKIRWGDTLWDISEAFYRNPWLYNRIARFNNIRNPDLIISGTSIRIPPKN